MQRLCSYLRKNPFRLRLVLLLVSGIGTALYSPFSPLGLKGALLKGAMGLIASSLCFRFSFRHITERRLNYALWMGSVFAGTCVVGGELQVYATFRIQALPMIAGFLCWLGLSTLFSLGCLCILCHGGKWLAYLRAPEDKPLRRPFLLFFSAFGIILLCWLPFGWPTIQDSPTMILHPISYKV
jgi:hypothetical protein